jgi:hypothetical protein
VTSLDDLAFERVIGHGGSATVWRARQGGPVPRNVAVKRIRVGDDPRRAERLRQEARVLVSLDHPHIVRVLDVIDDGGEVAIVMPVAEGGTLADVLAARGALPVDEALRVVLPLADALASAHRGGIVHGDPAPANVLLTSDGAPLLADFGAAVAHPAAAGAPTGTAGYVDPQVIAGAPPTPASDVHALAAAAYHLLTGRLPYDGTDDDELVAAAEAGHRVPVTVAAPHVPDAIADVLDAALSTDPAVRPQDGATLAARLRAATSRPAGASASGAPALPTDVAGNAAAPRRLPGGIGLADGTGPRRGLTREFGPGRPPRHAGGRTAGPVSPLGFVLAAVIACAVLAGEMVLLPADRLVAVLRLQAPPLVVGACSAGGWLATRRGRWVRQAAADAGASSARSRASSNGFGSHPTP